MAESRSVRAMAYIVHLYRELEQSENKQINPSFITLVSFVISQCVITSGGIGLCGYLVII